MHVQPHWQILCLGLIFGYFKLEKFLKSQKKVFLLSLAGFFTLIK